MKNLISMTDFVLEQRKTYDGDFEDLADLYLRYSTFLKQPLELWMFIPCDDSGNELGVPYYSDGIEKVNEYKQAKKRCLFNGVDVAVGFLWLNKREMIGTIKGIETNTVEDFIFHNLQLTQTAIKQIGL